MRLANPEVWEVFVTGIESHQYPLYTGRPQMAVAAVLKPRGEEISLTLPYLVFTNLATYKAPAKLALLARLLCWLLLCLTNMLYTKPWASGECPCVNRAAVRSGPRWGFPVSSSVLYWLLSTWMLWLQFKNKNFCHFSNLQWGWKLKIIQNKTSKYTIFMYKWSGWTKCFSWIQQSHLLNIAFSECNRWGKH